MKKIITDELVEKLLNKTEFNEASSHDEEHIRKVVLDHYDSEITDDWNVNCEFFIYEETTADGYSVYVCTYDDKNICVSESVHYYDGQLSIELKQAITEGIAIYVDDLENHYIEDAVRELYINLAKLKTEEIEEELINQGYEQDIN
tara:strand:- start:287 stop:724 length:438 start_codon:yes stop_codon:yes gene_type:complete